jgi:exonuclease SbcC
MHITKIELEDIKSHKESKFIFERGTTAVMGENGAGKSTLIEAIAWTLFDVLDYKKDDFLRRGAKKGAATVTFLSGLDEREYRVYRDTKTGYYVYDPKLKTRIAEKKDEVTRFLWQHLGVEVGTDLESLFKSAIGVPQGTFTADFLKSPALRKPIFDKLLKVEEYKQGADKLLETANFIKNKQAEVENKLSFAKGKLEGFEKTEEEFEEIKETVGKLGASAEELEKSVAEKQGTVAEFDNQEVKVRELKETFDKLSNERSRLEVVLSQKEKEKNEAEIASDKIKEVEKDHERHLDALGKLKEFERERGERDKLNAAVAEIKQAIAKVQAEEKATKEKLDQIAAAHQEIEQLKPKVDEQKKLEAKRDELSRKIAKADEVKKNVERLEKKLNVLRTQHTDNKNQIEIALANKEKAVLFQDSLKRDEEIKNELARFRAELKSNRKFQAEVRNNLCPILSEKCLNLKEGETLESFVSSQFSDVENKIDTLEIEQRDVAVVVDSSRQAERAAAALPTLEKRRAEIVEEGKTLREDQESEKKKLDDLPEAEKELGEIKATLSQLGSPFEKIKLLEKEIDREISVREKLTDIESNFERLESERRFKVEQIETYKDLDENWKTYSTQRDETATAHREFVANENLARSLPEKARELAATQKELEELNKNTEKAEKEFETENKNYDQGKHALEKNELQNLERRAFETKNNLEHAQKREKELKGQIQKLKAIKLTMAVDETEKERLEKIGEATAFIRSTLKEAAPRVAKNYVYHVSVEANQMFREITGNAERTLHWTDDYGIELEENGHRRPFVNLSGGEQMSAALSIRLALLKQLSDVRIAFFDEPTTNMDLERRERLAEQISQITEKQTFDQLFVISHDDTFEAYVDNVLTIKN